MDKPILQAELKALHDEAISRTSCNFDEVQMGKIKTLIKNAYTFGNRYVFIHEPISEKNAVMLKEAGFKVSATKDGYIQW